MPPPNRSAGKRAPRRAIELDGRRTGRPGAAGKRAFEIRGRRDEHDRERRAERGDGLAERGDLRLEAVDAGDDRFEPGRRAERPRDLDGARERLAAMAAARIVMADDMRGADGAQPLRIGERCRGVVRVEAEAEVRRRALLGAELDADACLPCGAGRRVARHGERDGLIERGAARERVGPGQRERPDIGLVGGVGPVALVLHLERVAFHAALTVAPGAKACAMARRFIIGCTGSISSGNFVSKLRPVVSVTEAVFPATPAG